MRKLLLAAAAICGLIALGSAGATAAPVVGAASQPTATTPHIVQANYWYHHHHWHHRRWSHGGWHYWD